MPNLAALTFFVAAALGCSSRAPTSDPDPSGMTEATPDPAPQGPTKARPRPTAPAAIAADPEQGCSFGDPIQVWPRAGVASIVAAPNGEFALVGVGRGRGSGEDVFVVGIDASGASHVAARTRLAHPVPQARRTVAPAISALSDAIAFAVVDAEHHVQYGWVGLQESETQLSLRSVGEGAALHYSPAMHPQGQGWLIAWTDASQSPNRLQVRRIDVDGRGPAATDLTPSGGSASAPTFLTGSETPTLVFLDARQGLSVAYRSAFDGRAFGSAEVFRPLNVLTAAPSAIAVRLENEDWLGVTAVGEGAQAYVPLFSASGPRRTLLAPGGRGVVRIAAAADGTAAYFAADHPTTDEEDGPRAIEVRSMTGGELSAPTSLETPDRMALSVRIARSGAQLGIAFGDESGVYAVLARCALPDPS